MNYILNLDISHVSNDLQIHVIITILDDFTDRYHLSEITYERSMTKYFVIN